MTKIKIELTEEQLEVLIDYLTKKTLKLEEAGLNDSKCYLALYPLLLNLCRIKKIK